MIYLGADHGGLILKTKLMEWLVAKGVDVEDLGAEKLEKEDDFVDYAMDVAESVLGDEEGMGIVICRNGVGVSIVANRYPGVRCALGFDSLQTKKARSDDDVNVLALPADYIDFEEAKKIVEAFIETEFAGEERFVRRLTKIEAMTDEGCGDGCGGECGCEKDGEKSDHECVCGGNGECQCRQC